MMCEHVKWFFIYFFFSCPFLLFSVHVSICFFPSFHVLLRSVQLLRLLSTRNGTEKQNTNNVISSYKAFWACCSTIFKLLGDGCSKTSKNYFICHLRRFTSRQQKQMRRILSLPIRRCRRHRWLLKCTFAENALQSQLKPKRCTHAHSQVAICVFVIYLSVADINNFARKMVAVGTRRRRNSGWSNASAKRNRAKLSRS